MRKLLCIWAVLTALSAWADDFHARYTFTDFGQNPLTTRKLYLTPIWNVTVSGTNLVTADRRSFTNDAAGSVIVSNMVAGGYLVEFQGPYTLTAFTNVFGTNVSGLVNAKDYITAMLMVNGNTTAYSQTAADARFMNVAGDTATNPIFRGTVKFPEGGTVGDVLTKTNANGAAAWLPASGGGLTNFPASAITNAPWTTTNQVIPIYNVRDYGAVCNLRVTTRCNITSGSANLTSVNGAWTAADIGKPICVYDAGVLGRALVTTITAVGSTTSITLADAAATTIVTKSCYYGTDDTVALQTVVDIVFTNGTGGTIFVPAPTAIAGALADAGTNSLHHNAVFYAPPVTVNGASFAAVTFEGPIPQSSSPGNSIDYDDISIKGGALVCFVSRGTDLIASRFFDVRNFVSPITQSLSCLNPPAANVPMNAVRVRSVNMAWVAPRDANIAICDFSGAEAADFINSFSGPGLPLAGLTTPLTGTNGFALKMPANYSEPYCFVINPTLRGTVNGLDVSGLTSISGGTIQGCSNAITVMQSGSHAVELHNVCIASCKNVFAGVGCAAGFYGLFTSEDAVAGWFQSPSLIGPGAGGLYGIIVYEKQGAPLPDTGRSSAMAVHSFGQGNAPTMLTPLRLAGNPILQYIMPAEAGGTAYMDFFETSLDLMWRLRFDLSDGYGGSAWKFQPLGIGYAAALAVATNGNIFGYSNIYSTFGQFVGNAGGLSNVNAASVTGILPPGPVSASSANNGSLLAYNAQSATRDWTNNIFPASITNSGNIQSASINITATAHFGAAITLASSTGIFFNGPGSTAIGFKPSGGSEIQVWGNNGFVGAFENNTGQAQFCFTRDGGLAWSASQSSTFNNVVALLTRPQNGWILVSTNLQIVKDLVLGGSATATNGFAMTQLSSVPSMLLSSAGGTNWQFCTVNGRPYCLATNYALTPGPGYIKSDLAGNVTTYP